MRNLQARAVWWKTGVVTALVVAVCAARQIPTARHSNLFDSAQLLRDLQTLSADDMQGRRVDTPGGAKARAFVIDRFKASGIQPFGSSYEEPFTFASGRGTNPTTVHGVNVVGHIDGTKTPKRYIVVSAHYDHIGVRNGVVNNGADDNASGAAALFSVASYFAAHRPANSMLFVAFDGEEEGLRGAQAFVKQPPVDAATLGIDLNMDMIGRDPADKLFVVGIHLQPNLRPSVEAIAAKAPVKLLIGHDTPGEGHDTPGPNEDWTKESDHYAFVQAHIPALYFGVEDFDQHHQPTDKFETMSFDFYVRAVETMIQAAQYFDAHLAEVKTPTTR
jgi:hypothetical protein